MKKEEFKMNVSVLYDFSGMMEMEEKKAAARGPAKVEEEPMEKPNRLKMMLKKMGVAGFVFFTVKGLLWLIVPAVAANLMT